MITTALKSGLSHLTFRVMYTSMAAYESLNIPAISTARPFSFYRNAFFSNETETNVLNELNGQKLIDIGCGLTPFTDDSMFQACRREGIEFYGIDPKVNDGFRFGIFDRLKSVATGSRSVPNARNAGLEKAIPAYANDLPFENESVDMILSCWLIMSWIRSDDLLADIFQELDRILKPGGSIRLFPTNEWGRVASQNPQLATVLECYEVEQRFMLGANLASAPPAYTTRFIKPC